VSNPTKPVLPEPDFRMPQPIDNFSPPNPHHYTRRLAQSILEQGIQYGREQMREECAKFCRENQVSRSPSGKRSFMLFDTSFGGRHEGMDFADALEKLP